MKEVPAFGFRIDRAIKALRQDLNRRFKRNGIDLTPEQWLICYKLYQAHSGLSQNELADESYKDAPTISRIIDRLVMKKQVAREPVQDDRRRHKIRLTDLGISTVKSALPLVQENRTIGWEGLSENDYNDLCRLMDQLYANYLEG